MKRSLAYILVTGLIVSTCSTIAVQDTPPAWNIKALFQKLKQKKLSPTARKAIITGIVLVTLAAYSALVGRQVKNKLRNDLKTINRDIVPRDLTESEKKLFNIYFDYRVHSQGDKATAEKALNDLTNSVWKRRSLADFAFDALAYPIRIVEPRFPW